MKQKIGQYRNVTKIITYRTIVHEKLKYTVHNLRLLNRILEQHFVPAAIGSNVRRDIKTDNGTKRCML